MNHENEVKVRCTLPDRHVHLTINNWTIANSIKETNLTKKIGQWTMKMRSWSDDNFKTDIFRLQSFHTPNI